MLQCSAVREVQWEGVEGQIGIVAVTWTDADTTTADVASTDSATTAADVAQTDSAAVLYSSIVSAPNFLILTVVNEPLWGIRVVKDSSAFALFIVVGENVGFTLFPDMMSMVRAFLIIVRAPIASILLINSIMIVVASSAIMVHRDYGCLYLDFGSHHHDHLGMSHH